MNQPTSVQEAAQRVIDLMSAIMRDIDAYAEDPGAYSPEYFADVITAAGDAMLLAVWLRDHLKTEE